MPPHPSADFVRHPYDALTPEVILAAVETYGLRTTGGLLALNSYENRVYRVEIEDAAPVAAKFYRPGRWTDEAILEEHAFAQELAAHEIPAVAPLAHAGRTLHRHAGFRFALFPWQGGRAPELNTAEERALLGRYLGRLHRLGAAAAFRHRRRLSVEEFGTRALAVLRQSGFVPEALRAAYFGLAESLLADIEQVFRDAAGVAWIRLHGDCHLGNILWTERRCGEGAPQERSVHIVDFDDCMTGPAVQDLWMFLAGERAEQEAQLASLLAGYCLFMDFDPAELALIEALRTLRLIHYSAWIAQRWDDPAFPRSFPWFDTQRYWEEQVLTLRQQVATLAAPPLAWPP